MLTRTDVSARRTGQSPLEDFMQTERTIGRAAAVPGVLLATVLLACTGCGDDSSGTGGSARQRRI